MSDIHNYERRIKRVIDGLESSDYSEEDLEKLKEFREHLEAQGCSVDTVCRYLNSFITLSEQIDFRLLDPSNRELKRLVARINNNELSKQDYSVWTQREFKKALRRFYGFLFEEEDPEVLAFMSTNVKESEKPMTSPNELPRPEGVRRIVRTLEKLRDRTLIFFTWDTGGRIGEILNVKWKDISFTKKGAKVRFRKSKSRKREIPIYESVEYLREWKQRTPRGKDKEFVFVNVGRNGMNVRNYGEQMKYPTARKVFSQAGKEIDADFKTNPHAFRKGRATYLASKGMNAAQLCEYFGWSDFSTAKTYIRMAQKDLDNAMKKIQGIEPEEDEEVQDLKPVKCDCGAINPSTRDYCKECGQLISKEKELLKKVKTKEAKEGVKSDLLKEMFSEFGVSEKEVEEKISRKVKKDLEEKDFL